MPARTLKTSAGNCIRCNSANIAFALRSTRAGFIYLARSTGRKLVKAGFSAADPHDRIYIANLESYGGASDWRIRSLLWSESAGRLELDLHAALRRWSAPQIWVRNGWEQEARELYSCTLSQARAILFAILPDAYHADVTHMRAQVCYNFFCSRSPVGRQA